MGKARIPRKAVLFCALMYPEGFDVAPVFERVAADWGRVLMDYGPARFDFTRYYEKEMGSDLVKKFVVFDRLHERASLPAIKNFSNELEQNARGNRSGRVINIDPGYITRDKLVLASTKDFFHRIYLGEGIFGEVTLHFSRGRCRHFSWTYPDYRLPEVHRLVLAGRDYLTGLIAQQQVR